MAKGQKALQRDAKAELDRDGIERIPADAFLWRGYRSTHARDAIAAAKRAVKP